MAPTAHARGAAGQVLGAFGAGVQWARRNDGRSDPQFALQMANAAAKAGAPGTAAPFRGRRTMDLTRSLPTLALACGLVATLALAGPAELRAQAAPPQVTEEGLQLHQSKDARLVYLKPGATFDQYDRVVILDTLVEFSEDWQRDYNANVMGVQGRVSTRHMDRAKADVAAAFKKVFTEELQKDGGYQVVESAAPDVLVLRPAILNLQVTAPDLMTSDVRTAIVNSAGQMTLYLELWDPTTNTLLARIMDAQADDSFGGMGQRANRATNQAAMNDILKDWARKLRKHLDAAHGR